MSRSIADHLDQLRQGNLAASVTFKVLISMTDEERAERVRLLGHSDATDVRKMT